MKRQEILSKTAKMGYKHNETCKKKVAKYLLLPEVVFGNIVKL